MNINTLTPAVGAAYTPEEAKKIRQHKTAFTVMLVIGIIAGIGTSIALIAQSGAAMLIALPFIIAACAYQFPAIVAGVLTFPTFNRVFAKCLSIPVAGWIAWLVLLYIGLCIWVFVGLFTLPHQVKKLKRQLKELEEQGV
jgi:uncharacterized membrane protein